MFNITNLTEQETFYDNYSYYDYDPEYELGDVPAIPLDELLVPVLVYSVTYITGLIGNILILVAVTGQKQVDTFLGSRYPLSGRELNCRTKLCENWKFKVGNFIRF